MAQRGRVSAASLAVVRNDSVHAIRRPRPPDSMEQEEAEVWMDVVEGLPADWFSAETHGILTQYCRHAVRANQIKALIKAEIDKVPMNLKNFTDLVRLELQTSAGMSALATRMRMTQQSSYDRKKSKPQQTSQKLQLLEVAEDQGE